MSLLRHPIPVRTLAGLADLDDGTVVRITTVHGDRIRAVAKDGRGNDRRYFVMGEPSLRLDPDASHLADAFGPGVHVTDVVVLEQPRAMVNA